MTTTVLSGPERRRRWGSAEKLRIVEESLAPGTTTAAVARQHDVHPNLVHAWRRQARAGTLVRGPVAEMMDGGCGFVPVAVAPDGVAMGAGRRAGAAEPVIELVLRNGRILRLPAGVAPGRAAALADALEGR
jgi:transposase